MAQNLYMQDQNPHECKNTLFCLKCINYVCIKCSKTCDRDDVIDLYDFEVILGQKMKTIQELDFNLYQSIHQSLQKSINCEYIQQKYLIQIWNFDVLEYALKYKKRVQQLENFIGIHHENVSPLTLNIPISPIQAIRDVCERDSKSSRKRSDRYTFQIPEENDIQ